MCNCVLRNAMWGSYITLTFLLLELKNEGLRSECVKFDQPSELRNDFQRCLRQASFYCCPSYKCVVDLP